MTRSRVSAVCPTLPAVPRGAGGEVTRLLHAGKTRAAGEQGLGGKVLVIFIIIMMLKIIRFHIFFIRFQGTSAVASSGL